MVGRTIAHYQVLEKLGEGGMGVVYRSRDTKLGRDVAVKILPEQFAHDSQRMARFSREAHLLASLNHPHIASIYGLEEQDGVHALVMELVEGPTLADRIAEGAIPLEEALRLAQQMAEALEYAHEHGIVHRDLKPANVKVTEEGAVKLLDFGVAKAMEDEAAAGDPASSPTLTLEATKAGVILGTAAYMSPEQARGKRVDKRTDIWAFGVVLYEMLTGRRLFEGETTSDTLAGVLKEEPKLDQVPAKVRRLLRRCLEKDPKKRLRDIGDVWLLLDEAPPVARRGRQWLPWAGMALFCLTTVALALLHFRETSPPARLVHFQIPLPEKSTWVSLGIPGLLSPDSRQLALSFVSPDGVSRLSIRPLDSLVWRPLAGTEGMLGVPIWSPDGRFLAFGTGGKLKKVGAAGGPFQTLCDAPDWVAGGFWTDDDKIVFGSGSGLRQVAAGGGAVTALTSVDRAQGETMHICPFPLPDGRHFVYGRYTANLEQRGLYIGVLDAKPEGQSTKRLLAGPAVAQFAPSPGSRAGYLLFVRERTLVAQPFDPGRLELTGDAIPISGPGVNSSFSASTNGVLAYVEARDSDTTLTWFDRQGKVVGTAGEPHPYSELALSPDGSRVAAFRGDSLGDDLWLIEFARRSSTRLTTDAANESYPVWSPDGKQIAFFSNRGGVGDLYRKSVSGSGEEELLLKSGEPKAPLDWSRDGRFLLYSLTTGGQTDLWILPLEGDRKPTPYLATKFNESYGRFSPDGRWVVYVSNVSGKDEIYVSPFAASTTANAMSMVSTGGGKQPRWRQDGKELYYLSPDNQLIAVEVTTAPSFKAGVPKPLFSAPIYGPPDPFGALWTWDVAADGQRFLINREPAGSSSAPITVVLNWQAGLRK